MTGPVALALPALRLGDDEAKLYTALRSRLVSVRPENARKNEYYEGKFRPQFFGISVPPDLADVEVKLGWAGIVVDSRENRMAMQGWSHPADLRGLDEVFVDNRLQVESRRAHLDALVTGMGFVTVGKGEPGEPDVLVTVESSSTATAVFDQRTRRVRAGLAQTADDDGRLLAETLYLPDETVTVVDGEVERRDRHRLGRVPMVRLVNRDSPTKPHGRSEITEPVRYFTDAAARTLLGMEINREFYTAPQRYALGAEPEQFGVAEDATEAEKARAGWTVAMGRLNVIPANEDGTLPSMGQFTPTPPTPYIEQIRGYSQLVAAHAYLPPAYLGFVTDNPTSGDSIRQHEHPLVNAVNLLIAGFTPSWREVGALAALVRDGSLDPAWARKLDVQFADPATPVPAAVADYTSKLVAAGVLPADSPVTLDQIGLTPQQQAQVREDQRRARITALMSAVPQPGQKGQPAWQQTSQNQPTRPNPQRPGPKP